MKRVKQAAVVLAILIIFVQAALLLYSRTDHYRRHYGHAADRMAFYARIDGHYLTTDDFTMTDWDGNYLDNNKWAYSFDSDYGMYAFRLQWNGKQTVVRMENLNNWLRTIVIFDLSESGITQTNYYYNAVPPASDTSVIIWGQR